MLNDKLVKALNDQVNFELYSSYIYLSMSACFSSMSLNGMANWMRVQAQEEVVHVMKFYDYILERDGQVVLDAIQKPQTTWESPLAAFQNAYEHEQIVTGRINDLMDIALELKDHASASFLKWFVDEQVEEEASVKAVIDQLKLIKDAPQGLFMVDRELGQRVFTPPPAA